MLVSNKLFLSLDRMRFVSKLLLAFVCTSDINTQSDKVAALTACLLMHPVIFSHFSYSVTVCVLWQWSINKNIGQRVCLVTFLSHLAFESSFFSDEFFCLSAWNHHICPDIIKDTTGIEQLLIKHKSPQKQNHLQSNEHDSSSIYCQVKHFIWSVCCLLLPYCLSCWFNIVGVSFSLGQRNF